MTVEMSKPTLRTQGGGDFWFAPNFSVYVLPPDAVCLYSEDRKFFLRGELYCALAERIGAGERRGEILGALSVEFPPGKIEEAFRRLLDRRFVARSGAADGACGGLLGEPRAAPRGGGAESPQPPCADQVGRGNGREPNSRRRFANLGVRVVDELGPI